MDTPDAAAVPPRRRPYVGAAAAPPPERRAWAVLLMIGSAYAPGALVAAYSLRLHRTRYPIVCTVTDDVPHETREQLLLVYDRVVVVPYIAHRAAPFESKKQAERYSGWIERSFTKWNVLNLTEYDKVILVDADIAFLANVDELFDLRAPAACYTQPWAYPWQRKGGLENPYLACVKGAEAACDLPHGARIPAQTIMKALYQRSFIGGGFLTLLKPDRAMYDRFLAMLDETEVYGADFRLAGSGHDEISIAELYARQGVDWTHIHQRYAAIPWKKEWVSRDIRGYHYLGRKPWDMDPEEWPDLADWWRVAERLCQRHPQLRDLFFPDIASATPLDADATQLRITNDARTALLSARHEVAHRKGRGRSTAAAWREADAVLARWLAALALAPAPGDSRPPWAGVYRRSTLEDTFNNRLASDVLAAGFVTKPGDAGRLVQEVLTLVERRLSRYPRPSKIKAPTCTEEVVEYGLLFRADLTPRLRQMVAETGCEKAVAAAMRYAIILREAMWVPPQALADRLYADFGFRGEAFASPLDSRLLGKEGAWACGFYPDVDAPFGLVPPFLGLSDWEITARSWLVAPPAADEVTALVARRVLGVLGPANPQSFFVVLPSRARCAALLRDSPYHVLEVPRDAVTYHILSTEPIDVHRRFEVAFGG